MLTSLFGDLRSTQTGTAPKSENDDGAQPAFAAVPIMQSVDTTVDDQGRMVDRHLHDLVVSGSPALAIREHFNTTRSDLETASRVITLLDPVGMWASAVVKALSDAGGRPIERLHLREKDSLRTLALIERTTLARRNEETLTVYHAEVRAPGRENAEIPVALMERSHMTTVIVGPRHPHAIDALLESLRHASALATWRCPNLLFILPPNAAWIAPRIGAVAWSSRMRVHMLSESLSSASAVWNAMLGMWNHVKERTTREASAPAGGFESSASDDLAQAHHADETQPPRLDFVNTEPFVVEPSESPAPLVRMPDAEQARAALAALFDLDGLIGCAVVDVTTGLAVASQSFAAMPTLDMARLADSSAQMLRAGRQAARGLGFAEPPDEMVVGAGTRRIVIHGLAKHPKLLLVALLDRQIGDLVRCRRKLAEVEAQLG
ncbi:MAG: hypothetical protein ABIO45_02365 [Burkholderiaceae bacterium]